MVKLSRVSFVANVKWGASSSSTGNVVMFMMELIRERILDVRLQSILCCQSSVFTAHSFMRTEWGGVHYMGFSRVFLPKGFLALLWNFWKQGQENCLQRFSCPFFVAGFLALFWGHRDSWQSICHETQILSRVFQEIFKGFLAQRFSCPLTL